METSTAHISLHDKDVLRVEYKANAYVDVMEFKENLEAYRRVMTTDKVYLLTIANEGAEPSPEVRKIFASKERSVFKIAEAFVLSSFAQRIIANFVMKVQRPHHPVKFFNSEEEARDWLYSVRAKRRKE